METEQQKKDRLAAELAIQEEKAIAKEVFEADLNENLAEEKIEAEEEAALAHEENENEEKIIQKSNEEVLAGKKIETPEYDFEFLHEKDHDTNNDDDDIINNNETDDDNEEEHRSYRPR